MATLVGAGLAWPVVTKSGEIAGTVRIDHSGDGGPLLDVFIPDVDPPHHDVRIEVGEAPLTVEKLCLSIHPGSHRSTILLTLLGAVDARLFPDVLRVRYRTGRIVYHGNGQTEDIDIEVSGDALARSEVRIAFDILSINDEPARES
jgi:hypothetical protein